LTAGQGDKVKAPLIEECFANFECKVIDTKLIPKYSLFILEVVKAHVAVRPKYPQTTIHYRGGGVFMVSGENTGKFRKPKSKIFERKTGTRGMMEPGPSFCCTLPCRVP
jgi:flavin reductase (DIM6/NTAB) family NADH-FMN oxidoreductase RutF